MVNYSSSIDGPACRKWPSALDFLVLTISIHYSTWQVCHQPLSCKPMRFSSTLLYRIRQPMRVDLLTKKPLRRLKEINSLAGMLCCPWRWLERSLQWLHPISIMTPGFHLPVASQHLLLLSSVLKRARISFLIYGNFCLAAGKLPVHSVKSLMLLTPNMLSRTYAAE